MKKIKVKEQKSFKERLIRDLKRHKWIWIMAVPIVLYYIVFCYIPLGGVVISFMDYRPGKGILESDWVGLKHFISFLTGPYAGRVISNTVIINLMHLIFGFPAPILLAIIRRAECISTSGRGLSESRTCPAENQAGAGGRIYAEAQDTRLVGKNKGSAERL